MLDELCAAGIEHGLTSIERGGPLVPFVLSQGPDGEVALDRFLADTLEESVDRAREAAQNALSGGAEAVALVYDGYVTDAGQRLDAILVEAVAGQERLGIAQPYRPGGRLRRAAPVGEPLLIDIGW